MAIFFDEEGNIDWIKPTWPKVQRHFWIWAIPLLVVSVVVTIVFSSLAKRLDRTDIIINSENPQYIEWPKGIHYDGIGRVDDCAVVYSEKGYFAVMKDGQLEKMLFTGGSSNGIYRSQIFSIQKDGLIYLYSSSGELKKTFMATALPNSFKKQTSDHKQTITINSYTYEIQRGKGIESVIAKSDAGSRRLIEKKYVNIEALRITGYVFWILGSSILLFYFMMNIPAIIDYLKRRRSRVSVKKYRVTLQGSDKGVSRGRFS